MNEARFFSSVAVMAGSSGAMLSGCMVGPDYHRASAPVAPQFKEQPPEGWAKAAPSDAAPKGDWWTEFHDPLLDELEPQVAVSNQTVRQDYATYLQAVAEVKVARAQLFPTLGLTGSVTREGGPGYAGSGTTTATGTTTTGTGTTGTGTAGTTGTGTTGTTSTRRGSVTSATLEGTASWTPDIWGQVRRLIEENTAIAQSDEATLANATLSEQTLARHHGDRAAPGGRQYRSRAEDRGCLQARRCGSPRRKAWRASRQRRPPR